MNKDGQDPELTRVETKMMIERFERNRNVWAKIIGHRAWMVKTYHTHLINQGFDKHEALELIKAHGYSPPSGFADQGQKGGDAE